MHYQVRDVGVSKSLGYIKFTGGTFYLITHMGWTLDAAPYQSFNLILRAYKIWSLYDKIKWLKYMCSIEIISKFLNQALLVYPQLLLLHDCT
jgi:hypothetical protein